ncbi:MAG: hypothetical protein ACI9RM_002352 [Ulvibacter sp.]|jgi:hypothetical protein
MKVKYTLGHLLKLYQEIDLKDIYKRKRILEHGKDIQETSRLLIFDQDIRLSGLSKLGGPIERLAERVDFGCFRKLLETNLSKKIKR